MAGGRIRLATKPKRPLRMKKKSRKMVISKSINGLFGAKSHSRSMRYCESVDLTPVSGAIATHIFCANSIYDPNITGTGHQVRFFDQIMPYFQHFTVISSKISVVFTHTGNITTSSPYMCALALRGTQSTEADANGYLENGLCAYDVLPHSSDAVVKLNKSFSAKKFFNLVSVRDNNSIRGTSTTNPGELAFYHLSIDSRGNTGDALVSASVTIDYTVTFSEPRPATQS